MTDPDWTVPAVLGLDYSAGRPRGKAVKDAGYDFVIRYCGRPGTAKNATTAEVADMIANGVAVALVFETTAARAGEGFNAGVADAQAAVAHQAALGIPASRPIYYAVDYDADPTAVEPYFRGLNSVAGPDSAYGSFRVVQRLRADGLTVDSWQTVAWSHGQADSGRDVFQRIGTVTVDGIACDVNEAFTADFGQYPLGGNVTSPNDIWMAPCNGKDPYSGKVELHAAVEWLTLPAYRTIRIEALIAALTAKVDAGFQMLSNDEANIIAAFRAAATGDSQQIAEHLAPLLIAGGLVSHLSDDDAAQLATVVNNELDRRAAIRANTAI